MYVSYPFFFDGGYEAVPDSSELFLSLDSDLCRGQINIFRVRRWRYSNACLKLWAKYNKAFNNNVWLSGISVLWQYPADNRPPHHTLLEHNNSSSEQWEWHALEYDTYQYQSFWSVNNWYSEHIVELVVEDISRGRRPQMDWSDTGDALNVCSLFASRNSAGKHCKKCCLHKFCYYRMNIAVGFILCPQSLQRFV